MLFGEKFRNFAPLQRVGGGSPSFLLLFKSFMIDKQLLTSTVLDAIADTDIFLVDITVSAANLIVVEIDSAEGIDIDTCADLTRRIESVFDRDVEDYELEVGSAGLTAPFKVRQQYLKNVGNEVEVLTADGRKFTGILQEVADDSDAFTVAVPTKVKHEGQKRPVIEDVLYRLTPAECKYVKYNINFK